MYIHIYTFFSVHVHIYVLHTNEMHIPKTAASGILLEWAGICMGVAFSVTFVVPTLHNQMYTTTCSELTTRLSG